MVKTGVWACPCVLMVFVTAGGVVPEPHGETRYDASIQGTLALLPKPPSQVAIVDVSRAADDLREALRKVDAFIVKGSRVVYLTSHSEILQGTISGWPMYEHMLAAIIWHEMAHIDGAAEAEAQRREEALWTDYVMTGRVDRGEGMRYLALLTGRRRPTADTVAAGAERTFKDSPMIAPIAVIPGRR